MLNVIFYTYAHRQAVELRIPGTTEERRRRILDAYLRRMLDHRPSRYPHDETLRWLAWLARTLTDPREQVFYLDRLDQTWLPSAQVDELLLDVHDDDGDRRLIRVHLPELVDQVVLQSEDGEEVLHLGVRR